MSNSISIRLPKLVVTFNVQRNNSIQVIADVYKDGNFVRYNSLSTYSEVGNMAVRTSIDPIRRRVSGILRKCITNMGVAIDYKSYEDKITDIISAIEAEEGDVWRYFESFKSATYDEVTDAWSRV